MEKITNELERFKEIVARRFANSTINDGYTFPRAQVDDSDGSSESEKYTTESEASTIYHLEEFEKEYGLIGKNAEEDIERKIKVLREQAESDMGTGDSVGGLTGTYGTEEYKPDESESVRSSG